MKSALKLLLTREILGKLSVMAHRAGRSRSKFIEDLIWKEWVRYRIREEKADVE